MFFIYRRFDPFLVIRAYMARCIFAYALSFVIQMSLVIELSAYSSLCSKFPSLQSRRHNSVVIRRNDVTMQIFPFQNVRLPNFFNDDSGDEAYHESRIR
jgi:hypothetical protein